MITTPQIPANAKIWMYQADRVLTTEEVEQIESMAQNFVSGWQSHGASVEAVGYVLHNIYIVLASDEDGESPSGCSIDSSVNFIKAIGTEFKINFFERFNFAYLENGEAKLVDKDTFGQLYRDGVINDDTIVINNLVTNTTDYNSKLEVPLKESWHKNFV